MTDPVRILTQEGIERFRNYLGELRLDGALAPPFELLTDSAFSAPAGFSATVSRKRDLPALMSRYDFGCYLVAQLSVADKNVISRNYGLWTWLALYYFDFVCEAEAGVRSPDEDAVYLLPKDFNFRRYYRHMVRSPWWAVSVHGESSKVLLAPRIGTKHPLSTRGEIFEQLASRQSLFGSRVIIQSAFQLYCDSKTGRPKGKTGGSAAGSPRRLADVLNQLDLTFDLGGDVPDVVIGRLPKEFAKWK